MLPAIPTVAQQIAAAAACAAALDSEPPPGPKRCIRPAMRNGKYGNKGLKAAILEPLPIGRDNALVQAEIRALLPDIDYAHSGLSSALCVLAGEGLIFKTGNRNPYRYYRKP